MGTKRSAHILVAPLDWGLGHTTRCVPIITHLLNLGHKVTFAGNNWQREYINATFPGIDTLHLDGYNVHYSKHVKGFMFTLLGQLPGLVNTIRREQEWLKQAVAEHNFDAIISDNRYGLHHPTIPSAIMTHQVMAQSGMGSLVDAMLSRIHYKRLEQFNSCWVIDVPGYPNLSGKLGHPKHLPRNAQYLGLLSQIQPATTSEEYLLVLLSGPEPQRTLLSNLLWEQAAGLHHKVVFVEGSNNVSQRDVVPVHIEHYQRITKEQLQPLLQKANMVVCRSGYSTLMDLVALGKKAILIPTPGQTEQEYLGKHLHREGVYYSAPQKGFSLQGALKEAVQFPFKKLNLTSGLRQYTSVIEDWLQDLVR